MALNVIQKKSSVFCRKKFCHLGQTAQYKFGRTERSVGQSLLSIKQKIKTYRQESIKESLKIYTASLLSSCFSSICLDLEISNSSLTGNGSSIPVCPYSQRQYSLPVQCSLYGWCTRAGIWAFNDQTVAALSSFTCQRSTKHGFSMQ